MATHRPPAGDFVFPEEQKSFHTSSAAPEMTTTTSRSIRDSNTVLILVISGLVLAVIGLVLFLIIRRKRRKSRLARDKLMTDGHPNISIPTLGTHYELNSLLSINTIGRKDSHQSEISMGSDYNVKTAAEKTEHIIDDRVSKYIDYDIGQDVVDGHDVTLETILNTTRDPPTENNIAPKAEQEMFETPRDSQINPLNPAALAPELMISPPSPAGSDRERPRSELYGQARVPALPVKRSIGHAASEMSLVQAAQVAGVTGGSERTINSKELPTIPPKLRPFIPPKQTINKSREDVHKINKEIMRQSNQISLKSCPIEAPQTNLTDTDYDFPASSEDVDTHEWEEYDEPQPVIPDTSLTEETSGARGEETDIDYDDPVHRYR